MAQFELHEELKAYLVCVLGADNICHIDFEPVWINIKLYS